MLELKRAQRKSAKLKLGVSGPSGSGKTLGALLIAKGLVQEEYPDLPEKKLWEKIAIIDSENGSGELYVGAEIRNIKIGEYGAITLTEPFTAEKYIDAINICVEAGMEVVIIDSTTHLWAGVGGLLEQQGNIAKRTGNSWSAWRDVTPMHNEFVDKMLQANVHIIATMRSKTKFVQERGEDGKTVVRKVGLNPIQRDGMEFEFTTFFEIDAEHNTFGSKDRTSLFDQQYFVITPDVGKKLMKWLQGGTTAKTKVIAVSAPNPKEALANMQDEVIALCQELGGSKNESLMTVLKTYEKKSGNPKKIDDVEQLKKLQTELNDLKEQNA